MFGHRIAMALETLLLTLPISLLFVIGAPDIVYFPYLSCGLLVPTLRVAISVLTLTALAAGWILSMRFIRRGTTAENSTLWTMAFLGLALAAIIGLSTFLPPSEPYGCWDVFRANINPVKMGLVLGIPLLHLVILKHLLRRSRVAQHTLGVT
jgi:hypothetical protein